MSKKRWSTGLLAAILLTVLAGCQTPSDKGNQGTSAGEAPTVSSGSFGSTVLSGADDVSRNVQEAGTVTSQKNAPAALQTSQKPAASETVKRVQDGTTTSVSLSDTASTGPAAAQPSGTVEKTTVTTQTTATTQTTTTTKARDEDKDGWVDGWYRPAP